MQALAFQAHVHGFAGAHAQAGRPLAAAVQHLHVPNHGLGRDIQISNIAGHVGFLDVEVAFGLAVGVIRAQVAQHPVVAKVLAGEELGYQLPTRFFLVFNTVGAVQLEAAAVIENQFDALAAAQLGHGHAALVGREETQPTGLHVEFLPQRGQLVGQAAARQQRGPLGLQLRY